MLNLNYLPFSTGTQLVDELRTDLFIAEAEAARVEAWKIFDMAMQAINQQMEEDAELYDPIHPNCG
jgi:hypothetical protein